MALQVDRGVRVLIVPPADLDADVIPVPRVFNAQLPRQGVPAPPQFHIQFQVQKSLSPEPNEFVVQIYNLSASTRDLISGTVRRIASWLPPQPVVKVDGVLRAGGQEVISQLGMAQVRLDAGWNGAAEQLAVGTATSVRTRFQGRDRVTTIRCTDFGFNIAAAQASKSFAVGYTALELLTYLVETLGLRLAQTAALTQIGGFVSPSPFYASGDCAAGINDICDAAQLSWFVDDGEVFILGDGETLPGQPVVVTPEAIPNTIRLRLPAEVMEDGALRIQCALAGGKSGIRVGYPVVLASSEQRGTYRCESVQHQGSNRGGAYTTTAVIRDPLAALF